MKSNKSSKRQIVVSKTGKSQSTNDQLQSQNIQSNNYFITHQKDLNKIQQRKSYQTNSDQYSQSNGQHQDQDQEIIQSMKQKQKIIKQLKVLKAQAKHSKPKLIQPKIFIKNKHKTNSKTQISAKTNTLNSPDKKMTSSTKKAKQNSNNKKIIQLSVHNSASGYEIVRQTINNKLINIKKRKEPKSVNPTCRKSRNSLSSSYFEIIAPKKLEYDPNILLRSPNKYNAPKFKQRNEIFHQNEYGLPQFPDSINKIVTNQNEQKMNNYKNTKYNLQIKDNSHTIPYRFSF